MSNPGQPDVQVVYSQYQTAIRQLQFYEQQEALLANQLEQYRTNLETVKGLQSQDPEDDFIFPLSDVVLIKAKLADVKEVLVDIGSDYYLPSSFQKAEEAISLKIKQVDELLERITKDKNQLQTIATQLQNQLSILSQS